MYLVFDLETTGLVPCLGFNIYPPFSDNKSYDNARIIQMAWVVLDKNYKIIEEKNYIIKRDGFNIHKNKFHRITNEISDSKGVKFEIVVLDFMEALKKTELIIAHNVISDTNILLNHLYRYKQVQIFRKFISIPKFCTSIESAGILKIPLPYREGIYKYPSLQELYTFYFKRQIHNAHDAMSDTKACAECFIEIHKTYVKEMLKK